jgi:surface antigen
MSSTRRRTLTTMISFLAIVGSSVVFSQQRQKRSPEADDSAGATNGGWVGVRRGEPIHAARYGLTVPDAPSGWKLGERRMPESAPGPFRYQVALDRPGKSITISVFRNEDDIVRQMLGEGKIVRATLAAPAEADHGPFKETVLENAPTVGDPPGFSVLIEKNGWVYEIVETGLDETDAPLIGAVLLDGVPVRVPSLAPVALAAGGPCCGEVDPSSNTYLCCDTNGALGNCTWYCEYRAIGSNNFKFDQMNRNAYTWLTKVNLFNTLTNSVGGTIPIPAAIMVFTTAYSGGTGHVAYVDSVNVDGSINVHEQNYCATSCTRAAKYTVDQLRSFLAGYIYPTVNRPAPTARYISGNKGAQTSVDDHNRTNVYNFSAEGPGFPSPLNSGERMWGSGGAGTGYFHWMASGANGNSGKWAVDIGASGLYKLEAFIPNSSLATARRARYKVATSGSVAYSGSVDQASSRGLYVQVRNPNRSDGLWSFPAGINGNGVRLEDNYGGNNPESGVNIILDALRFTRM